MQDKIISLQTTVMTRRKENKRPLPRRETTDPYAVFISEYMLQQTQVSRVISKYHQFLAEVPDRQTLANLPKSDLLILRSGLGYNSRALRMQAAAQQIVTQYDSRIPTDRKTLQTLPGIGAYMSASLLAFVYNLDVPVIDINIKRVLITMLDLDYSMGQKQLETIAQEAIPTGQSRDWHNALMDYGALVLTASKTGIQSPKQSKFKGSRRRVRG